MSDIVTPSTPSVSEAPVTKKKNTALVVIIVVLLVVLGLVGGSAVMAYEMFVKRADNAVVRSVANALPIPMARVGSKAILYRTFIANRDVVKKFLASPAAAAQQMNAVYDDKVEQSIIDKLMVEAIVEEMAAQKNLTVSSDEINKTFDEVVAAASSTTPDMSAYLRDNFGWTEEDFRQNVLRPAMLQDKVGTKLMEESGGDELAFQKAVEKRLTDSDVVNFLKGANATDAASTSGN